MAKKRGEARGGRARAGRPAISRARRKKRGEARRRAYPGAAGKARETGRRKSRARRDFSRAASVLRALLLLPGRALARLRSRAKPSGVILAAAFMLLLGLLFARSATYSLNQRVYSLEQELSQVQGEIDSKEGQLISSADIKEVEKQARALGMTEARPGQYIYESYSQKNISNGQLPGLSDYLSMFTEIREGMLWP